MTTAKAVKGDKVTPAAPLNAFAGKTDAPDDQELALALGAAKTLWDKLVGDLQRKHTVNPEWGSSSRKAGWSLRLTLKDRIILYVIPLRDSLQVALVLGDRAVKAARQSKLPGRVLKTIADAKRYAEGTGIRLAVTAPADLVAIEQLAQIKIDN